MIIRLAVTLCDEMSGFGVHGLRGGAMRKAAHSERLRDVPVLVALHAVFADLRTRP